MVAGSAKDNGGKVAFLKTNQATLRDKIDQTQLLLPMKSDFNKRISELTYTVTKRDGEVKIFEARIEEMKIQIHKEKRKG